MTTRSKYMKTANHHNSTTAMSPLEPPSGPSKAASLILPDFAKVVGVRGHITNANRCPSISSRSRVARSEGIKQAGRTGNANSLAVERAVPPNTLEGSNGVSGFLVYEVAPLALVLT